MSLVVNSELKEYPKENPVILGQMAGTIDINDKAIEKAAVGGTMRLHHPALNQGEPVDVQANLDFTPELAMETLKATIAKPVSLIKNMASLEKLNAAYDFKKDRAFFDGEGNLEMMGAKVALSTLYKKSNFQLKLASDSISASIFSLKHIVLAHVDKKGWSMGARRSFRRQGF
jgi:hypothetical protein